MELENQKRTARVRTKFAKQIKNKKNSTSIGFVMTALILQIQIEYSIPVLATIVVDQLNRCIADTIGFINDKKCVSHFHTKNFLMSNQYLINSSIETNLSLSVLISHAGITASLIILVGDVPGDICIVTICVWKNAKKIYIFKKNTAKDANGIDLWRFSGGCSASITTSAPITLYLPFDTSFSSRT